LSVEKLLRYRRKEAPVPTIFFNAYSLSGVSTLENMLTVNHTHILFVIQGIFTAGMKEYKVLRQQKKSTDSILCWQASKTGI
jgi:hypothetical protein